MLGGLVAYLVRLGTRPAPRAVGILAYLGVLALVLHRFAHCFFRGTYFLARFINHFSRFLTAIDIHPVPE